MNTLHTKTGFLNALFALFAFPAMLSAASNPSKEIRQQQRDFALFKKGLFAIEAKIDRHTSMDSIQRMLNQAEKAFGSSVLSPVEEFKWYSRCISLVGSGHTQVNPSRKVFIEYYRQQRSLPFDMIMKDKKLYAAGYSNENTHQRQRKAKDQIPLGAEIVRIDGKSIDQWVESIGSFVGSDENDAAFRYFVAGQAFDFYRFLAEDVHKDELSVTYINRKDTLSIVVKTGFPPLSVIYKRISLESKQAQKDRKSFGTFRFIGNDVAYFRFPSFAEAYGRSYSEYLKKQFSRIKKKGKIDTVIIDVRGNGGGNVQTELLSYFLDEQQVVGNYTIVRRLKFGQRRHIKKWNPEFRRYKKGIRKFNKAERKFPDFNGQLKSFPIDTALIFRGNVIVLTDEATFSASSLLASQLKTLRNARIMGSRAGGTFYTCNAGTLTYRLPHSNIRFIFNPNACASVLDASAIDAAIKNVDIELVPEYDPKPSKYKKNWEDVVKMAVRYAGKQ